MELTQHARLDRIDETMVPMEQKGDICLPRKCLHYHHHSNSLDRESYSWRSKLRSIGDGQPDISFQLNRIMGHKNEFKYSRHFPWGAFKNYVDKLGGGGG